MVSGYTKKYKLADRHKFIVTLAKMMGYLDDDEAEDPDTIKKRSINVTLVSAKGKTCR